MYLEELEETMLEDASHISIRTRIHLAKELVSCARMIVANYAYDDLKKEVVNKRQELLDYVKEYGVYFLKHSGFVIHHTSKHTTHFIENGRSNDDYSRMLRVLKDESLSTQLGNVKKLARGKDPNEISNYDDVQLLNCLEREMDNLILLPAWYHNYLHNNGIYYPDKRKYYEEMKALVKRVIRKRNKKRVKALEFHGNSIKTAIDSIQNLATVVNNQGKAEIIDGLAFVFKKLQDKILQDF